MQSFEVSFIRIFTAQLIKVSPPQQDLQRVRGVGSYWPASETSELILKSQTSKTVLSSQNVCA